MYSLKKGFYSIEPKKDPRDRISIEIGDSKQKDFFPQLKLMRWDNEANVSLRLQDFDNFVTLVEDDKLKLTNHKKEIHFYEVGDNHEIEVVLNEKPIKNIIEFSLVDKGVEYWYQPPLTNEEILKGMERPDNVVGSYAIYTSEKKINITDGKLYRTGKVGHIYRPKIIDSAGKEVWGELHIENNKLTVTIPQDFLDNAVYPVRHAAGLTFGHDTNGASLTTIAQNLGTPIMDRVGNAEPGVNGTLDKITVALNYAGGNITMKFMAFLNIENTGTNSHTQVAGIESTLSITSTTTAYDFTASSESLSSSNSYLLNVIGDAEDADLTNRAKVAYDSTGSRLLYDEQRSGAGCYAASKESPWTSVGSSGALYYTIYGTYTASAGGGVVTPHAKTFGDEGLIY